MVAIFTGVGAGFERGSRSALGSAGLLGSSSFGRDGQGIFLNAANGNLLVTDQDEFLIGRGPDVAISRTYNSLGALDDNGDFWRQSTDKRVFGLVGTANTSGSSVRRVSADGSEIIYTWNGSHYEAKAGEGATDKLTYSTSTTLWTWRDGATQISETYASSGSGSWQITEQADSDGNKLTFTYSSGKLAQITTQDGGYTAYTWSGSNITSITTGYTDLATSTSATLTRTRYTYDGQNRLSSVITDLTPGDNSIVDEDVYETTYTYHGSSNLVASIGQRDGAYLEITYDSRGRVTQLDQAVDGGVRTTTVEYHAFRTVVTDPTGQATTLHYNAAGQLTKVVAPPAQAGATEQVTEFEYAFPPGNLSRQGADVVVEGEDAYGGPPVDWIFATELIDGREAITARKPTSFLQPWDGWNHPGSIYLKGGDRPDGSFSVTAGETVGYRFAVNMLDGAAYVVSDIAFFDIDGNEVDYDGMHWNGGFWGWGENAGSALVPTGAVSAFIQVRPMDWGVPSTTPMGLAVSNIQFHKLPTGSTSVPAWAPSANLMYGGDLSAEDAIILDGETPGGTPTPWTSSIATVGGLEALVVGKAYGYVQGDNWTVTGSFQLGGGDRPDGSFSVRPGDRFSYSFAVNPQDSTDDIFTVVKFFDASGTYISEGVGHWNSASGWTTQTASGDVPAGAVSAQIHVRIGAYGIAPGLPLGVAVRNIQVHNLPFGSSTVPLWTDATPLGKLLRVTDSAGAQTGYAYDVNGNISAITDANGNTVQRTYDADNNLIRETRLASNAFATAELAHTRYVYDAENHLRYTISAEGRVTEYLYTTAGELEFTRQYTAAAHLYAAGETVPSLASMDAWRDGLSDRTSVKNQEVRYDARGNITETLSYGVSTSLGAPSTSEGYSHQFFAYDQAGKLLSRNVAGQATETFVYDGLGRMILSTDLAGGTTRILFVDDERTTIVTTGWDIGETGDSYSTTSVYNEAGDLISRTDSGSGAIGDYTNGGTRYQYVDANGRVRIATDGAGNYTYYLYDKTGRKIADIGHDGQITEHRYDEAGRLIASGRYVNVLTGGQLADLADVALDIEIASIRPAAHANDIWQWSVYDDGGRIVQTIAGDGSTTRYQYDNADRLVATTSYYTKLSVSAFIAAPPIALTLPSAHANDSLSRVFYDSDGKVIGALNPEGSLSQIFYDGSGQKIREIAYAGVTDPALRADASFDDLLSSFAADPGKDVSSRFVYDGQGHLRWTIDALNRVTEFVYAQGTASAAAGLVRKTVSYATAIGALGSYDFDTVKAEVASIASSNDRVSYNVYNDRAQLAYAVDAAGAVTAYTYDTLGRTVKATQFAVTVSMGSMGIDTAWQANLDTWASSNATGARVTRTFYTERGEVAFSVDALGYVTKNSYDSEGRLVERSRVDGAVSVSDTSTIDDLASAIGTQAITEYFYYDALGRVSEAVDGAGVLTRTEYYATGQKQSVTVAHGQGRDESRTVYIYDAAGKLLEKISAEGAAEEAVESYTYDGLGNLKTITDANSGVTTYAHDRAGRVISVTNAMGGITKTQYDMLGRAVRTEDARGAVSFTYHDQLGRVTTAIDAEGYATSTTYTAFGEIASVTRHALKQPNEAVPAWLAGGGYAVSREMVDGRFVLTARNTGGEFPNWYWAPWGGNIHLLEGDRSDGRVAVTPGDILSFSLDVKALTPGVVVEASISFLLSGGGTSAGAYAASWDGETWTTIGGSMTAPTNAVAMHIEVGSFRPDGVTAGVFDFALGDIVITRNAVNVVQPQPRVMTDSDDAITSFQYDKLGRVTRITDSVGAYEEFTLDAFGQRISVRNKLGGITTNSYDARGLLTEEILPVATHDADGVLQSSSVTNQFSYDRYGNRSQMIEAVGLAEQRTTTFEYDLVGRVVYKHGDMIDAAESSTQSSETVQPSESYIYDLRGNLIESRDPAGAATLYWYDLNDRVTHIVSPLGSLTRNFYDDNGNLIEARIYAAALEPPADALGEAPNGEGVYRSTEYTFDALNRMTESRVRDIQTATYESGLGVTTLDLVTTFEYDASGNVIRSTDARGGHVWSYFDRLGRKTTQIDAANYRTDWTYDADGNVVTERRYATTSTAPSSTTQPPSAPSTSSDDRVTSFEYDKMGRRTKETRLDVLVHNGSGAHVLDDAVIQYAYNGLGQVTQKIEATGDAITYTYDSGGRLTMEQRAGFTDHLSNWVSPTVDYTYDGLGGLTRSRQYGATGSAERITKYEYAAGRLSKVTDAEGFERNYVYDIVGRLVREEYELGSERTAIGTDYDLEGRVVRQGLVAESSGYWGYEYSNLDSVETTYNAFGEVASRILNTTVSETYDYDAAGRVWRALASDGTWKYFMYDAAGNQTLAIASDGMDIADKTLEWVLDRWGSSRAAIATTNVADIVATITQYDARNLATHVREPQREIHVGGVLTLTNLVTERSYNAFGEVAYEINPGGHRFDYIYNAMGRQIEIKSPSVAYTSASGVVDSDERPIEHRYFDVSGRLVASRDANGNLTRLGLLAGSGYGGAQSLVTTVTTADSAVVTTQYDIHGDARVVTDQISRQTTQQFDRMGRLLETTKAGLTEYHRYDGLGQKTQRWNSQLLFANAELMSYDRQGRVISHTAMGGDVTTYEYSIAIDGGFLGWHKTTTYANGKYSVEETDRFGREVYKQDLGGNTSVSTYDNAGRITRRTGGEAVNYTYYNTGRLASIENDLAFVTIPYEKAQHYFGLYSDVVAEAGDFVWITDQDGDGDKDGFDYAFWHYTNFGASEGRVSPHQIKTQQTMSYAYDAVGNLVQENVVEKVYNNSTTLLQTISWKDAEATYDALARLVSWSESAGASPAASSTYAYDLAGNVRKTSATFSTLDLHGVASGPQTSEKWYLYDALNRVTTSGGELDSGAIVRGTSGVDLYYDLAGQRVRADTSFDDVMVIEITEGGYYYEEIPFTNVRREDYTYDAGGRLNQVFIAEGGYLGGTPSSAGNLRSDFDYDLMGRQTSHIDYLATPIGAITVAFHKTSTWNDKSQLTAETTVNQTDTHTHVNISAYSYGSGTSYALGSALSIATEYKRNNVTQSHSLMTNTYAWRDGAVQSVTSYKPDVSSSATNTSVYHHKNVGGAAQLISVTINDGRDRNVAFENDLTGQAMRRDEDDWKGLGNPHEIYYRFGGKQTGYIGNNGTQETNYAQSIEARRGQLPSNGAFRGGSSSAHADFDQGVTPFTSYDSGSIRGTYTVRSGETLSSIASNLWGDASLWYKIAEVNGLASASTLHDGQQLVLPAGVIRSTYNASTFTPYDPGAVLGDTVPTSPVQPKPAKNKCGGLGQILLVIVSVAVTAIVAPWAVGVTGSNMLGGALAAAAGSAASQSVGVAAGIQDKFSWNAVAMAGVSGFVGGGIQQIPFMGGTTGAETAIRAVASNALTQGVSMAVGLQSKFSWTGLAASGVYGYVGGSVTDKMGVKPGDFGAADAALGNMASTGAATIASAAMRSVIDGTSFGDNVLAALPDAVGSTIGSWFADTYETERFVNEANEITAGKVSREEIIALKRSGGDWSKLKDSFDGWDIKPGSKAAKIMEAGERHGPNANSAPGDLMPEDIIALKEMAYIGAWVERLDAVEDKSIRGSPAFKSLMRAVTGLAIATDVYFDRGLNLDGENVMLPRGVTRVKQSDFGSATAYGGALKDFDQGFVDKLFKLGETNRQDGFFGALYHDDNVGEFIWANRGTETGGADKGFIDYALVNVPNGLGLETVAYEKAIEIAQVLDSKLSNVSFAGHSLGGGLAAAQSMVTGNGAITFNASGVPDVVVSRHGRTNYKDGNILNYVVSGDPLNTLADGLAMMPNSRGKRLDMGRHYNRLPSKPGSPLLSEAGLTKMSYGAAMSQSGAQHSRAQIMNGILNLHYFNTTKPWK